MIQARLNRPPTHRQQRRDPRHRSAGGDNGPVTEPRRDLLASVAPLARALRRIEDQAAAGEGLTMWQYAILAVVDEVSGLNQGEVADRLAYSRNRIIGDLDLLEHRQLLARRPAADRRANVLATTPEGTRVMQQIRAEIHAGEDELLAALPGEHRSGLLAAVHTLADTLRTGRRVGQGTGTSRPGC
jgi:DNA-binding MarR family transcriptional regulator